MKPVGGAQAPLRKPQAGPDRMADERSRLQDPQTHDLRWGALAEGEKSLDQLAHDPETIRADVLRVLFILQKLARRERANVALILVHAINVNLLIEICFFVI